MVCRICLRDCHSYHRRFEKKIRASIITNIRFKLHVLADVYNKSILLYNNVLGAKLKIYFNILHRCLAFVCFAKSVKDMINGKEIKVIFLPL